MMSVSRYGARPRNRLVTAQQMRSQVFGFLDTIGYSTGADFAPAIGSNS
jgi:hypothetical protein